METVEIILVVIVIVQFFEIWGLKRNVSKLQQVATWYMKERLERKAKAVAGQLGDFLEAIFKDIDGSERVEKVNLKNKINEKKEAGAVR